MIFAAAVTTSIGFSYTQAAWDFEPNLQRRLEAHLKDKVHYETSITLSGNVMDWFKRDQSRVLPLIVLTHNLEGVLDQARRSPEHFTSDDIDKALKSSVRNMVPEDLIGPPAAQTAKLSVTGSTKDRLKFDAEVRAGNRALRLKAVQAKAAATAFIAQIANISVTSVPLLNEVLGAMIDAAAEHAGKSILDSLPLEQSIKVFQSSNAAVEAAVGANADRIGSRLFLPKEGVAESPGGTKPCRFARAHFRARVAEQSASHPGRACAHALACAALKGGACGPFGLAQTARH